MKNDTETQPSIAIVSETVSDIFDEGTGTLTQAWELCVNHVFLKLNVRGKCRKMFTLARLVDFLILDFI